MLLGEAGLADEQQTRVGDLSGGMRQRLGFAVALLADPPISFAR
jgi:ABC-type multidrug transport system ATPase subunit